MRVAVIGAGPAGLCTAKCLLEVGYMVVVYEKFSDIGGLWNFQSERSGGVYEGTVYQTSRFISGFSDFPMPESMSVFPRHEDVLQYLRHYAEHFDLLRHVELESELVRAVHDQNGWRLDVLAAGRERTERFDAIAVCTGMYWHPLWPKLTGLQSFDGQVLHSSDFKRVSRFRDKRVVVVGNGVSGMDIAAQVQAVARSVDWSFGKPNWVKPRWLGPLPYESGIANGLHHTKDEVLGHWRTWLPEHYANCLAAGLIPDRPPFAETFGANDDIARLVKLGAIVRRSSLVRVGEKACEFADGVRVECDAIILATGYENFRFPFFDQETLSSLGRHDEGLDLYEHVFHPELPQCAFIFHVTANAPAMPTIELQARWFAKILEGAASLPNPQAMREAIDQEALRRRSVLNPTRYRSNHVDGAYLLRLAQLVGVVPDRTQDFDAYIACLSPPTFPSVFRLHGDSTWYDAHRVLDASRSVYPLKSHHFGDARAFLLRDCSSDELARMYRNGQITGEELARAIPMSLQTAVHHDEEC